MRDPKHHQDSFPTPFTLAIDDSDTPWGGCTTHLAWIILAKLSDNLRLTDYPLLVRLNPVVPRKTRGNAAVVIRGYTRLQLDTLYEVVEETVNQYVTARAPGKSPGVAIYNGVEPWRDPHLRTLYLRGLREYIPQQLIMEVIDRRKDIIAGGGTGLTGAVLSLASLSPWDPYTYELIAYRRMEYVGKPRCVEREPYREARYPPCEYGNYDLVEGRLAAAPGGPDPVLIGFRGNDPGCLGRLSELLCEPPAGWVLYRTNQHTGAGPVRVPPRPYNYVRLHGRVSERPKELPGGHIIVVVETQWGRVPLAFYRETRLLRDAARLLSIGDEVVVEGGVVPRSKGDTVAVDVLIVKRLSREVFRVAPRCPRCGARMESMGRGKGYRCPKCGYRDKSLRPVELTVPRRLVPGRYTSTISSARHLTMFNWWSPGIGGSLKPLPVECFVSVGEEPPSLSFDGSRC